MTTNHTPESGQPATPPRAAFDWRIQGQITTIDHGASLASRPDFMRLMAMGALAVITFDPAGHLHGQHELDLIDDLQIVPNALLGDGEPVTLHACLDPTMSATLAPLNPAHLAEASRTGTRVLTQLPLGSLQLDTIEELTSVDWLVLDACHDNNAVLVHGSQTLADALLIHVRIPLMPTHHNQTGLHPIAQWMAANGFVCYRFENTDYQSAFPADAALAQQQATRLAGFDAVFVPDAERLAQLDANQRTKLAFLMDTVHGIHDFTHHLLAQNDPESAREYLVARGYATRYHEEDDTFTLTADYSPAPW